jgi:hypothetical protein
MAFNNKKNLTAGREERKSTEHSYLCVNISVRNVDCPWKYAYFSAVTTKQYFSF